MNNETRFYKCEKCGNVVGSLINQGAPIFCCNREMTHLKPTNRCCCTDNDMPKVEVNGKRVHVKVGDIKHDMSNNRHTGWVYLETNQGGHRKSLCEENRPEICFELTADEHPHRLFAYCNRHGLWETQLQPNV